MVRLQDDERVLSRERRQVHRRIEYLRGTGAHEPGAANALNELVERERDLSRRRRELHTTIDQLRAQS